MLNYQLKWSYKQQMLWKNMLAKKSYFYFHANKSNFTKVLAKSGGKKKSNINLLSSNSNTIYVQPPTKINFLNNKKIEKNVMI